MNEFMQIMQLVVTNYINRYTFVCENDAHKQHSINALLFYSTLALLLTIFPHFSFHLICAVHGNLCTKYYVERLIGTQTSQRIFLTYFNM